MNWRRHSVIIAGNGPSLADIPPGLETCVDRVIRTNSFFLEQQFYLGRRIDLAVIGGDPRVARFMIATLKQARRDYDIKAWSAYQPRVDSKAIHRMPGTTRINWPRYGTALQDIYRARVEPSGRLLFSGTQALFFALSQGCSRIVLTGMDLYTSARRYVYPPGRWQRRLLGHDLPHRGVDRHLHDPALDRAVIEDLATLGAKSGHWQIFCGAGTDPLATMLDIYNPALTGPRGFEQKPNPMTDWNAFAGFYPAALLYALRGIRRATRRTDAPPHQPEHMP